MTSFVLGSELTFTLTAGELFFNGTIWIKSEDYEIIKSYSSLVVYDDEDIR